jgi:hypothetical protein
MDDLGLPPFYENVILVLLEKSNDKMVIKHCRTICQFFLDNWERLKIE